MTIPELSSHFYLLKVSSLLLIREALKWGKKLQPTALLQYTALLNLLQKSKEGEDTEGQIAMDG